MRAEIRSKLNRLIWRQRVGYLIAAIVGIALLVVGHSYFLESWDVSEPHVATVVSFEGNMAPAPRAAQGGMAGAIIRLADGSEGLVQAPHPQIFVGDQILVRKETSKIFGFRRFRFVDMSQK